MALINRKQEDTKKKIEIELSDKTLAEVQSYMKFARLGDDLGWFFSEAANVVFTRDKEYKAWLSEKKKGAGQSTAT